MHLSGGHAHGTRPPQTSAAASGRHPLRDPQLHASRLDRSSRGRAGDTYALFLLLHLQQPWLVGALVDALAWKVTAVKGLL